jgi:NADPH:quinone reductase-like Zn-dependent oxidoreductase
MAKDTMKAARIHDYGGPERLQVEEAPKPHPGEGQVLIRVYAAGVNPADWKFASGAFRQFNPLPMPWTPGLEGSGVVAESGPGATGFKVGQAVFGPFQAAYAEYALAAASDLQAKPDRLSFEEAATIPVGALTAWGAVVDTAGVQSGQKVLIHGAAGGVGVFALQLAKWKGAHTLATTSAANAEFARELGAEQAIDYAAVRFETVVHDLDAVIDTVGGDLHERSLKVLRPGGVFVTVAGRLAPDHGKAQGVRAVNAGRTAVSNLTEITRLIAAGQIRPVVGKVFPLEQVRQAFELSQTGHGRGRIVLKIAEPGR